jgi:hypothetical protein
MVLGDAEAASVTALVETDTSIGMLSRGFVMQDQLGDAQGQLMAKQDQMDERLRRVRPGP